MIYVHLKETEEEPVFRNFLKKYSEGKGRVLSLSALGKDVFFCI